MLKVTLKVEKTCLKNTFACGQIKLKNQKGLPLTQIKEMFSNNWKKITFAACLSKFYLWKYFYTTLKERKIERMPCGWKSNDKFMKICWLREWKNNGQFNKLNILKIQEANESSSQITGHLSDVLGIGETFRTSFSLMVTGGLMPFSIL